MIRNARIDDVKTIHKLLAYFAGKGLLLGRSLSLLYDQLRDFQVYEDEDTGKILGVCALHISWENLAEIRSLAVAVEAQSRGVGTALVTSCIGEADLFGITEIFTLTSQPAFFERLGFRLINKKKLPHKVWGDCLQCPKFPDCDEEALIRYSKK